MEVQVTLTNITAAAILTQFLLMMIMFAGTEILRRGAGAPVQIKHNSLRFNIVRLPYIILISALVTLGFLVFSDEFASIWKPLFHSFSSFPTLRAPSAMLIMFTIDIITVAYLVKLTGGSRISPFSPIFFILPALAIFLRESFGRLTFYVLFVSFIYTIFMGGSENFERGQASFTYGLVFFFFFFFFFCYY